ncbi:monovalent cation/H+ antiporter complex subunit F [Thauera mechernichensis]|uniref:monovalent cation/H+ antiporter complex subunit F n=1 Tax=Thauera mechernichensis TaxID=82788 RepID=UPI00241042EF|nr:monovalent cation/H+ antiporter complex subunit F [Thauera mechernichensis]
MDTLLEAFSLLLLLSLVLGLLRVWKGPGFADRMLAAQLLGTTGVAMLVLLADPLGLAALRDVALVLALLAVLAVLAFVARVWDPDEQVPDGSENPSDTRTEAAPAQPQRPAGTVGRRRG